MLVRLAFLLCSFSIHLSAQQADSSGDQWQSRLDSARPLLGHRNWILIVDSAYPLQTSPGIETLETGSGQEEVIRAVMDRITRSVHVTPNVFMDAELPYVPEQT